MNLLAQKILETTISVSFSLNNCIFEYMALTIKKLREILKHFEDKEYDDFEVELWDYKHQQALTYGPSHGFSKEEKRLTFPVDVPYEDVDLIIPEEIILKDK